MTATAVSATAVSEPVGSTAVSEPVASRLRLHLPDEPVARRETWYQAVLSGADLGEVVGGADGLAGWLWQRWRTLEGVGVDRRRLGDVAAGYRRELWLWLAGERTWSQCCAGLVGRIERRIPA